MTKAEGQPNGAESPAPTNQATASPPGQTVVETDDFGLPIRRIVPRTVSQDHGSSGTEEVSGQTATGPQSGKQNGEGKKGKTVSTVTETTEVVEDGESSGKKAKADQQADGSTSKSDTKQADTTVVAKRESVSFAEKRRSSLMGGKKKGHAHKASIVSIASNNDHGVSEHSHQQLSTQKEDEKDDAIETWQEMPSYARYDMYDDNDKLIAREHDEANDDDVYGYGNLGGAGKGYTRVQMDEDAESANSIDDNTQYLFGEGYKGTAMAVEDEEEARDAVSQMQATKDLLTEGQRIAYVGIVRLEIVKQLRDLKRIEHIDSSKKVKKEIMHAHEAMAMWGQKMMLRLYAHMDINEAEQVMIEQLAEHGVITADLTPTLMANARVRNPMADAMKEEETEETKGEETTNGKGKEAAPPSYSEGEGGPSTPNNDDEKGLKSPAVTDDTLAPPPTPRERSKTPVEKIKTIDDEMPATPPPPYQSIDIQDMPEVKTPTQLPSTEKIDIDLRWTILCDLFLILISDSVYDARSRTLLERVAESLEINWVDVCRFEKRVTDALEMQQAADKENWNEDEHLDNRRKAALKKRYMVMGLATVGGGLVIGLSAGLLAGPIGVGLAAGFATIGVGGTSGFLGGIGGAAIITSTFAASGSYIGGKAANRRTGAVKTFEYRPLHNNKRVNLIVTVSGWLTGKVDDVRLPFSTVDPLMGDIYSVLWEPEILQSIGDTIRILATEALTTSIQQILGGTILTALMGAIQLPLILTKLSYLIDNPWAVSLDRAMLAGKILADSLIERNLGARPIILVGYSLGARVIFSCLLELAKRGAYGLVQDVYLFGSPIVVKREEYLRTRTVVTGRFVNGFNRNDWILGYLFRLTNGGIRRVAGLGPIEELPWIENFDVTDIVIGHMEYRTAMPILLINCGWMVESEEFTEIEDPDPEGHDQRQRELISEIEEARRALEEEGKAAAASNKKPGMFGGFFSGKSKAKKQEWEIYEEKGAKQAIPPDSKEKDKDAAYQGALFDVDAMRAEIASGVTEETGSDPKGSENIQIKEIESTLPPMSLDLPPPLKSKPQQTVLVVKSAGAPSTPRPEADEVSMVFDTSFRDKPPPPPPKDEFSKRPVPVTSQTLPNITLNDPWADDPDDEEFGKEKEISMTFA
ncbi:unnamed protein product [Clonostachys rhizophaga]|uniref:Transmembrane and coiled-coil domain-containing protein 4 n=1 Tax=Clonostachys rhizophaga TaxID=160324 RepID=A0A9N9YG04_9HYPO|nr:unnamed protein product [Clonostachys rhizophaga]